MHHGIVMKNTGKIGLHFSNIGKIWHLEEIFISNENYVKKNEIRHYASWILFSLNLAADIWKDLEYMK